MRERKTRGSNQRHLRALRELRKGKSLAVAARTGGITRRELFRYITKNHLARRKGKRWVFNKNRRRSRRRMITFSNGHRHLVVLSRRMASQNGAYLNAVRRLLHTNDPSALDEFAGRSIKDIHGHEFPLETRANALYRANAVPEPIAEIYQVIA